VKRLEKKYSSICKIGFLKFFFFFFTSIKIWNGSFPKKWKTAFIVSISNNKNKNKKKRRVTILMTIITTGISGISGINVGLTKKKNFFFFFFFKGNK